MLLPSENEKMQSKPSMDGIDIGLLFSLVNCFWFASYSEQIFDCSLRNKIFYTLCSVAGKPLVTIVALLLWIVHLLTRSALNTTRGLDWLGHFYICVATMQWLVCTKLKDGCSFWRSLKLSPDLAVVFSSSPDYQRVNQSGMPPMWFGQLAMAVLVLTQHHSGSDYLATLLTTVKN